MSPPGSSQALKPSVHSYRCCVQYSSVRKSLTRSALVKRSVFKPLISCIYVLHSILAENWLLEYGLHITQTWTSYNRNTLVLRKVTTRIRCRGRNMHVARERGRITGFDVRYITEVFPDGIELCQELDKKEDDIESRQINTAPSSPMYEIRANSHTIPHSRPFYCHSSGLER